MLSRQRSYRRARWTVLALPLLLAWPVEAAPPQPLVDQPYSIGYGDRLTTPVYINGKGPFDFLIDTGSSRTVVYDRARAQTDGLTGSREKTIVYGLNGITEAPAVRLHELRLQNEHVADLVAALLPNPGPGGEEPDGVLGLDVLEHYTVVLDHGQLKLFPRALGAPQPYRNWASTPLLYRKAANLPFGLWYIDMRFTKQQTRTITATALFDLGAGITIVNWQTAYRFNVRQWGLSRELTPQQVQDGLGRNTPVAMFSGLWMRIGERNWLNQSALIADAAVFRLLGLSDQPAAIVGPGLLKNDSLCVDFENRTLYLAE